MFAIFLRNYFIRTFPFYALRVLKNEGQDWNQKMALQRVQKDEDLVIPHGLFFH